MLSHVAFYAYARESYCMDMSRKGPLREGDSMFWDALSLRA